MFMFIREEKAKIKRLLFLIKLESLLQMHPRHGVSDLCPNWSYADCSEDAVRSDHKTNHEYNSKGQAKGSDTQEDSIQEGMKDSTNLKIIPKTDYKGKGKGKATVNEEIIQDEATQGKRRIDFDRFD